MASSGKRRWGIRAGATLGTAPISVAINFGVPLVGAGIAILYAAYFSGGTWLWVAGIASVGLGFLAFGSAKTFT